MTVFAGLDIGSTTIKAAVLNLTQGTVEHLRTRPFPSPIGGQPPLHYEIDPDEVIRLTREVLSELPTVAGEAAGLVVCSQMGGVILADASGRPLPNYLSWRDQRVLENEPSTTGTFFEQLKSRTSTADLGCIGNELRPGSAASLLYWLSRSGKLPSRSAIPLGLGDFVVANLCRSPPVTEPTSALGTLNLGTGQIHKEWFHRLGLPDLDWPSIARVSGPAGTIRIHKSPIPCFPAVGDHQAALLGAGLGLGDLSINVSTGAQVSLLTDSVCLGKYQTRPYFDGMYLNTITHLPAGRSLNALIDLLGALSAAEGYILRDPWKVISEAVEQTPDSDLDVNLAFFAGSMGDRGHVQNIRLDNLSLGHLFHAAFVNMADNYFRCAERLCPEINCQQLVLSGGLPQKIDGLRKLIEKRFGCVARSVDVAEETLSGLCHLARRIINSTCKGKIT